MRHASPWRHVWMAGSLVWILVAALYLSSEHDRQVERLGRWAAAVEAVINADPMVRLSAKELRAKLGDEDFIAAAPKAYPNIDFRDTLKRYEREMAQHPVRRSLIATFLLWALVPPLVLYALGLLVDAIAFLLRRRRSTTHP